MPNKFAKLLRERKFRELRARARGPGIAILVTLVATILVTQPALSQGFQACSTGSATGNDSQACGLSAVSSGDFSIAYGFVSQATADSSSAYGAFSTASGIASSAFGNLSTASGPNSAAFGQDSTASSTNATAIGTQSYALANSTAVGFSAQAGGSFSGFSSNTGNVAIGSQSQAGLASGANNGTAIGFAATANALNATATGANSHATASSSTALGSGASATASNSVAVGANSVADVDNTVSVGAVGSERKIVNLAAGTLSSASTDAVNGSQLYTANQRVAAAFGAAFDTSTGVMSAPNYTIQGVAYDNVGSAFGAVDSALTANATSISNLQAQVNTGSVGLVQQNSTTRTVTVGASTDGTVVDVSGTSGNRTVTGVGAGAVTAASTDAVNGSQLYATNQQVATNTGAIATLTGQVSTNTSDIAALNSTVAGMSATSSYVRVNSSAAAANASGTDAIAIGGNSQATQSGSIAIGLNSASTGVNAIAIGTGAVATGSVAVGAAASAGNGGAAFGDGAVATGSNSAALGTNASATASNSVAIGSGSTNNVANTVSFGSAGNERRLTNVAAGINPTDAVNVGQLQSTAAGFQSQIGSLQGEINDNQREARRGIVAAVAVAPVLMPSAPGKTTVAVNTGFYHGETGVGIGISHRLDFSLPTVVYGSYSNGGGSEHVGRAGMAVEF